MVKTLWLRSPHDPPGTWGESLRVPFLPSLQTDSSREAGNLIREDPRISILVVSENIAEQQVGDVSDGLRDRSIPLEVICLTEDSSPPAVLVPFLGHFEIVPWLVNPRAAKERMEELLQQVAHKALSMRQLYQLRLGAVARHGFLGPSRASRELVQKLLRAAETEQALFLIGVEGCGKCEAAQLVHDLSSRRCLGPFVKVQPSVVANENAAGRIFGSYRPGHLPTDPVEGMIHRASGGVLLLRNIELATQSLQVRLGEMLSHGKLFRVGSAQPEPVDTQLIVTADPRIMDLAREKKFRQELLDELAVNPIEIPPLRERPEDIPSMARHFGESLFASLFLEQPFPGFTKAAEDLLCETEWTLDRAGLRHFVQRFFLLVGFDWDSPVSARDLEPQLASWKKARPRTPVREDLAALRYIRAMNNDYPRVYHEALANFLTIQRQHMSKQEIADLFGKSGRWLEITTNALARWMLINDRRTPAELQRDGLWSRRFRMESVQQEKAKLKKKAGKKQKPPAQT